MTTTEFNSWLTFFELALTGAATKMGNEHHLVVAFAAGVADAALEEQSRRRALVVPDPKPPPTKVPRGGRPVGSPW